MITKTNGVPEGGEMDSSGTHDDLGLEQLIYCLRHHAERFPSEGDDTVLHRILIAAADELSRRPAPMTPQGASGLRAEIERIANDYHPDTDRDAPLALSEMRVALLAALELPTATPEGTRRLIDRLRSRAQFEDNGGCADRTMEDVGALLREASDALSAYAWVQERRRLEAHPQQERAEGVLPAEIKAALDLYAMKCRRFLLSQPTTLEARASLEAAILAAFSRRADERGQREPVAYISDIGLMLLADNNPAQILPYLNGSVDKPLFTEPTAEAAVIAKAVQAENTKLRQLLFDGLGAISEPPTRDPYFIEQRRLRILAWKDIVQNALRAKGQARAETDDE